MKVRRKQWVSNQYPKFWTDKIASRYFDRIIKKKSPRALASKNIEKDDTKTKLVVQY